MKYWLVALRQTLCLRRKSKVIPVPYVRSHCSEAAEAQPMNRLPSDTITAKRTVSLYFLRKTLVNKAIFFLVKIWIFAKLLHGISVATFGVKNKIKLLKA